MAATLRPIKARTCAASQESPQRSRWLPSCHRSSSRLVDSGQSGNPKGRKKGVKSEITILQELLQHKVSLNERSKTRKIALLEAILRKVAEDCLRGNIKSVGFLLNRYYATAAGDAAQADLGEDDKAVLEAQLHQAACRIVNEHQ